MFTNDLSEFCRAVLATIENPEAGGDWFSSHYGLCNNAVSYDNEKNTNAYHQLKDAINWLDYPFNDDIEYKYVKEKERRGLYTNAKRLAFLREHANV